MNPPKSVSSEVAIDCEDVRVVVSVCTFDRNDELDRLLRAIRRNVDNLPPTVRVGVVVVDDNPDGRARAVCDRHSDEFPLGLHYRHSGAGNISVARNIGLETALPISDWVALTDDDCEPVDSWIASFLATQRETEADAVTGRCVLRPAAGAPPWLTTQPFLDDVQFWFDDRQALSIAATNNSLIRASFFRDRPVLRFESDLGVIGGEDMVFFGRSHAQGLDIRFSERALVVGHESSERCTFRHQLRSRFWLGNTEYVTTAYLGTSGRARWLGVSAGRFATAVTRPAVRLLTRRAPQFRYSVALAARALGNALGALGVRVRHH